MKTQEQDAGDGSLVLGLAMWIQAVNGSRRIPPGSALVRRLQLVGTVRAIREGFSSWKPSTSVGADGQDPEVGAGMEMEPGWSRDGDGATVGSLGSSAPRAAGNPCGHRGGQ